MAEASADQPTDRKGITRGASLLASRQILTILISAGSAILLSRWLTPAEYGLFAQLTFWTFGAAALVIGDLGLALALVRLQHEPTRRQWLGAMTVMFSLLALGLLITSTAVVVLVVLGNSLFALLVGVLGSATSIRFSRAIPSARLQRDQRFGTIAAVEMTQSVMYFGLAVTLAGLGAGIYALIAAAVASELVGTVWFWLAARVKPKVSVSAIREVRSLLKVGLPVQGTGLLVGLTDAFQPIFIGALLGGTALGYVSWAYSVALIPLLVLASLDRVIVPVLATKQSDGQTVARWTERAIRINAIVAVPIVIALATNVEAIVTMIFSSQWLPATGLILAFLPAIVMTALSTPITQAFNARGQTGIAFKLAILWAALTWTCAAFAVWKWQLEGYAWFYVLLQLTYVPLWLLGRRRLGVNVLRAGAIPILSGLIAFLAVNWLPTPESIATLALQIAAVGAVFFTVLVLVDRGAARRDYELIKEALSRGRSPEAAIG